MTNHIEIVREALKDAELQIWNLGNETSHIRDALASLAEIEKKTIPELPDGYKLITLSYWYDFMFGSNRHKAIIQREYKDSQTNTHYLKFEGEGLTPRAAVEAAIKNIGEALK